MHDSRSGRKTGVLVTLVGVVLSALSGTALADRAGARLTVEVVESEPAEGRLALNGEELATLRQAVVDAPRDRRARFALVRGLISSGKLEEALAEARQWREHDAYNLVVVRLIGDLLVELGRPDEARRVYSAVVELLPDEPAAHRALATVLKQGGDLTGAYQRLRVASSLRPKDGRIRFELADAAYRLERIEEAQTLFEAIVKDAETAEQIRYPARQRLAQILAGQRLRAVRSGDTAAANALSERIAALKVNGGVEGDIKVYLTWDTDGSDIDLWVVNPVGERVSYKKKTDRFGGALYDDVTTGYGPESFTAHQAAPGTYLIQVNFYGTGNKAFGEARGEVVIVLNEGRPSETRHVLPYRLFQAKQTVTVARVRVAGEG